MDWFSGTLTLWGPDMEVKANWFDLTPLKAQDIVDSTDPIPGCTWTYTPATISMFPTE